MWLQVGNLHRQVGQAHSECGVTRSVIRGWWTVVDTRSGQVALNDPWAAPAASNLSRTGANGFVVESLGLGLFGTSNITLGDATTAGWEWGMIRDGLDFSFGRIAGKTEVLKEEWTSCGCEE